MNGNERKWMVIIGNISGIQNIVKLNKRKPNTDLVFSSFPSSANIATSKENNLSTYCYIYLR